MTDEVEPWVVMGELSLSVKPESFKWLLLVKGVEPSREQCYDTEEETAGSPGGGVPP